MIPDCHSSRNRVEMEILQEAAVRTSSYFDVLSNLKDAPDYYQSEMKRNPHRGSGIIHPNYSSDEHISYYSCDCEWRCTNKRQRYSNK
jgi:hypothetical protein